MDFSPQLHIGLSHIYTKQDGLLTIPTQNLDFSPKLHKTKATSHLIEVVVAQTVGKIQVGRLSRDRIPPSSRVKPYIHGGAWGAARLQPALLRAQFGLQSKRSDGDGEETEPSWEDRSNKEGGVVGWGR